MDRAERVLLVDDDAELGRLLKTFLVPHGLDVTCSLDGRSGLEHALEGGFALVLLDVMLPVLDGFDVLRLLRRRSNVPVIMLTARTDHSDRMSGFNAGADDYLPKPFHPEELLARCQALLRRAKTGPAQGPQQLTYTIGGLTLDGGLRQGFVDGQSLELTPMEYDLLDQLARAVGRTATRDEIWAAIYQREPSPFERSLDTHLSNVRRKLGGRGRIHIRTVRNTGYVLSVTE